MTQDDRQQTRFDQFNMNEGEDTEKQESDQRTPSLVKRSPLSLPDSGKKVGSLCWDSAREWNAYYSGRNQADNLFEMYNSYPISISLLGKLQHFECERVLIGVRDDEDYGHGTVYEFELEEYIPKNSPVYEWERGDDVDTQVCPDKDTDACHIFPELGSELFR